MGISQSKKTVQWRVDDQPHLFTVLIESLSVFRLITSTYEFHFCLNLFHISLFPVTFVNHLWCTQFFYTMWGGRVLSNFWSYGKGYYKRRWTYWFVFSFRIISMEIWNHYVTEVRKESVLAPSVDHSPFTCLITAVLSNMVNFKLRSGSLKHFQDSESSLWKFCGNKVFCVFVLVILCICLWKCICLYSI